MVRTSSGTVYHGEDGARTAGGLWRNGDVFIVRTTGAIWVRTDDTWVASGGFTDGFIELSEITPPSAPSDGRVRIYAADDGTGHTQLMMLFATGVAQEIGIQVIPLPVAGNPIGLLLTLTYAS